MTELVTVETKTRENVERIRSKQPDLRRIKAADDVMGHEGILIKLWDKESRRDVL